MNVLKAYAALDPEVGYCQVRVLGPKATLGLNKLPS